MITTVVQRWRNRLDSYRPAGEVINTAHYEVAPIPDDTTARAFIEQHHYAHTMPAARRRFGLYWGPFLVGVAVYSVPVRDAVVACLPGESEAKVDLGRFVLLDRVPGNGETWFLGRCVELLKRDQFVGFVSFSDPMARTNEAGDVVFGGHVGTIYSAFNGIYLGQSRSERLRLLPDGTVFSRRALAKIRSRDRGWQYASKQLVRFGAAPLGTSDDPIVWLSMWLPRVTRVVLHPGNHKYAWVFDKRARKRMPASLPYPKLTIAPTEPR